MIRRVPRHSDSKPKPAVTLGAKLDKSLLAYATAASAAGVSLLALTQSAEAKIVYTKSNIPITADGGNISFDVNGDGITDFTFYNAFSTPAAPYRRKKGEGYHQASLNVNPAKGNAVWELLSHQIECAAALPAGKRVGPKAPLLNADGIMAASFGSYTNGGSAFGPWLNTQAAFLGLRFTIHGKNHFGWARIKMNGLGYTDYITGYAYETVPNKSILTGKKKGPANLGALAAGVR